MEPFEIMISESQERMLCVVEPALLGELHEVCERWDVRATEIGSVTDTRRPGISVSATARNGNRLRQQNQAPARTPPRSPP